MFELFDVVNTVYSPLLAYLDAGTGSLVIQAIIGAIAGISVFGRNAIHRASGKVRAVFGGTRKDESHDDTAKHKAEASAGSDK